MDGVENGEKNTQVSGSLGQYWRKSRGSMVVLLVLRVLALFATLTATLLMALNKETKSVVLGIIGTSPVRVNIKAKFHHTPAFIFFVIINAVASFHNLLMLVLDLFGHKMKMRGLRLLFTTLSDMGTLALLSAATGAATAMAELGKNGNSHAQWNKICDKFAKYCDRGGGALIASYAAITFMAAIVVLSLISLRKAPTNPSSTVASTAA
ncbi:hypothetical protein Sjap_026334 [Stephania japonica]|uniref:CASP-like protein n=1 Tax=Stephania japonica TaxID=461633 RepID=A0AAP0E6H8_9MAGN